MAGVGNKNFMLDSCTLLGSGDDNFNKHKQLLGSVPEWVGVKFVYMLPVSWGKIGTPQTGRWLKGLKLRGTGMPSAGLSRHLPPSQFWIQPSQQTLIHSSDHLLCPNLDFVQHCNTHGRLEVASYSAMNANDFVVVVVVVMRMRGDTGIVIVNGVARI